MENCICSICKKSFSKKSNLSRHVKNIHTSQQNHFSCFYCKNHFNDKSNLIRHLISECPKNCNKNKLVECPLCNKQFSGNKDISHHYSNDHDINLNEESFTFVNFEEFSNWKKEIEKTNISEYVIKNSFKTKEKIIYYYKCHRDGFYNSKGQNIRHLKMLGSNKINSHCPSKLHVTVMNNDGKVFVSFIQTHVGHKTELRKIFKIRDIRKRHKIMLSLKDITIVKEAKGWTIVSLTSSETYQVENSKTDCKCDIKCVDCNACVHAYICSCPDSSVKWNMCKHIHSLCHNFMRLRDTTSKVPEISENNNLIIDCVPQEAETEVALKQLTNFHSKVPNANVNRFKAKLQEEFNSILQAASTIEKCTELQKALSSIKSTFSALDSTKTQSFANCSRISTKRKIEPQRNIVSRKKNNSNKTAVILKRSSTRT